MDSIIIVISILTVLMFDLGLTLKWSDFAAFAVHPKPVIAGLLGQIVVLPLVAFAISRVFSLPPVFAVGLVLIACCPGGSSSNIFSKLAGGDVSLSVSLTALSSIITLFTIPIILGAATEGAHISLPIGKLFVQNILMMLVPIVAGMLVNRFRPLRAAKIDAFLSKCAFPALIVLITIYFVENRVAIAENIGAVGLSVASLLVVSTMCGGILAMLFRLPATQQRTIVIEVGMQNAAQAIAIAASPFVLANSVYAVPAIIYALMMNILLLGYVAAVRRQLVTNN